MWDTSSLRLSGIKFLLQCLAQDCRSVAYDHEGGHGIVVLGYCFEYVGCRASDSLGLLDRDRESAIDPVRIQMNTPTELVILMQDKRDGIRLIRHKPLRLAQIARWPDLVARAFPEGSMLL